MTPTITILSCACLAVLIAETSGIVPWIKYRFNLKKMKPLDCPLCLAWWLALIVFVLQRHSLYAPFFAATSSILAIFISGLLRKL